MKKYCLVLAFLLALSCLSMGITSCKQKTGEPTPAVEEAAPPVQESAPAIEEAAPPVQESAPAIEEAPLFAEEPAPPAEEAVPSAE